MAQKTSWQYQVWYRDPKDSTKDELIVKTTEIVAASEDIARALAIRAIPEQHNDAVENGLIQVVVRPFK